MLHLQGAALPKRYGCASKVHDGHRCHRRRDGSADFLFGMFSLSATTVASYVRGCLAAQFSCPGAIFKNSLQRICLSDTFLFISFYPPSNLQTNFDERRPCSRPLTLSGSAVWGDAVAFLPATPKNGRAANKSKNKSSLQTVKRSLRPWSKLKDRQ